jgi:hypothetical protein
VTSSTLGSRLPRRSWPARPRPAKASAAAAAPLLTPARWRRLSARLDAERRLAKAALVSLYTGRPWSEALRGACRAWMLDGSWVDFWGAYVALLAPAERARWARALSLPGDRSQRAWRLVSARLLLGSR